MGVTDFFKIKLPDGRLMSALGVVIPLAGMSGQRLAVDAMGVLYPGMKMLLKVNPGGYTDAHGKLTIHLMVAFNKVLEYRKAGIDTIWIFDNAAGNTRKLATNAARRDTREASATASGKFGINGEMIADILALFDVLGVTYLIVQPNVEAEEYGAKMTMGAPASRLCAAMISSDSDVLMFGGTLLYYSTREKTYTLYEQDDVVAAVGSRELLVTAGVLLGTDFNDRSPGTPATALKRAAGATLTLQQATIRDYFLDTSIGAAVPLVTHAADIPAVIAMLCDRGFSREALMKKLAPPAPRAAAGKRKAAAAAAAAAPSTYP